MQGFIVSWSRGLFASVSQRCTCDVNATTSTSIAATASRRYFGSNSFREYPGRKPISRLMTRPSHHHHFDRPISRTCNRSASSSSSSSSSSHRPPPQPQSTPTYEVRKLEKQAAKSSLFSWGRSSSSNAPPDHPSDEDPVGALKEREMEKILLRRRMRRESGKSFSGGGMTALDVRCTTLDENGVVTTTAGEYDKLQLCSRYGIPPRDLRKLDSGVPTVVPTILVRRSAILLTILHLRVVITAKEVTLFDSVGTEDSHLKSVFVWDLEYALKNPSKAGPGTGHHSTLPYEFRALETCLISVTTALDTELDNIRALVQELLQALEEHIDRDNLRLLLQYSRKLADFEKRATLVMQCLDEVLENDDDLAAMYLTEKLRDNSRLSNDHEEVELLLESFSKQCEEIVSEVEILSVGSQSKSCALPHVGKVSDIFFAVLEQANVRSTEDIIELILDSNRNSLLGLDLRVSIATLGLTSGALVAGLFGMNLQSRLEEHAYAFPIVTLGAMILAVGVTYLGLKTLRRMRRVGLGWRGARTESSLGFARDRSHGPSEPALRWGDKWASRKRSKFRRT
ncbi:BQ2448_1760 [Microbotryum intermedium]|uniref:Magnesium transporter n=1 Tax=Microbotryum intermedium TaxID=269621 RepID=A0A238FH40_9BASI|nr:BQ2448_1760 [Microbotryum intermedium]